MLPCNRVVGVVSFLASVSCPKFGQMSLKLYSQLLVMDVSAQITMKGAAKCDKHCELQDSVNQLKVERILLFRVIPESLLALVS